MSEANSGEETITKPLANTNPFLNDIDCAHAYQHQLNESGATNDQISEVFSGTVNDFVAEVNNDDRKGDDDEKGDDDGKGDGDEAVSKAVLEWSEKDEGVVEISWQLPEGSATPLDYITLCYIGES